MAADLWIAEYIGGNASWDGLALRESGEWKKINLPTISAYQRVIRGTSRNNIYIAGSNSVLNHWDGIQWTSDQFRPESVGGGWFASWMSLSHDGTIHITGEDGSGIDDHIINRRSGGTWTTHTPGASYNLDDAPASHFTVSADASFFTGEASGHSYVWSFNGSSFTEMRDETDRVFGRIWANAAGEIWVTSWGDTGVDHRIEYYNGSSWSVQWADATRAYLPLAFWFDSSGDGWCACSPESYPTKSIILHFDSDALLWSQQYEFDSINSAPLDLGGIATNEVYCLFWDYYDTGYASVVGFNGVAWRDVSGSGSDFDELSVARNGGLYVTKNGLRGGKSEGPYQLIADSNDYDTTDGGHLKRDKTIASRCRARLCTQRGSWIGDLSFGSRLHEIKTTKNAEDLALSFIREALQPLTNAGEIVNINPIEFILDHPEGKLGASVEIVLPSGEMIPLGVIPIGV